MATHAYNIGYLYENSKKNELYVQTSQDAKIQSTGSGSYKVYGRLTKDGAAKPLMLIDASTYETTDTGSADNIYICDVSGLCSIYADNIVGMTKIYARVFAGT